MIEAQELPPFVWQSPKIAIQKSLRTLETILLLGHHSFHIHTTDTKASNMPPMMTDNRSSKRRHSDTDLHEEDSAVALPKRPRFRSPSPTVSPASDLIHTPAPSVDSNSTEATTIPLTTMSIPVVSTSNRSKRNTNTASAYAPAASSFLVKRSFDKTDTASEEAKQTSQTRKIKRVRILSPPPVPKPATKKTNPPDGLTLVQEHISTMAQLAKIFERFKLVKPWPQFEQFLCKKDGHWVTSISLLGRTFTAQECKATEIESQLATAKLVFSFIEAWGGIQIDGMVVVDSCSIKVPGTASGNSPPSASMASIFKKAHEEGSMKE
ncbi:hypothetical protein B0J14DRAFT_556727 [Halenospora varia]|nr:hypothetical protein B0J14DRAFT_556727 [Halenospora varia]